MARKKPSTAHGLVLIDKPAGLTSHDVVYKLRGHFGKNESATRVPLTLTQQACLSSVLVMPLDCFVSWLTWTKPIRVKLSLVLKPIR